MGSVVTSTYHVKNSMSTVTFTTLQECKNGIMGSWCSSITGLGYFQQVSCEHLCVGHTHEDVGLMDFASDSVLKNVGVLLGLCRTASL